MTLEELQVMITANTTGLQKGMNQINSTMKATDNSVDKLVNKIDRTFKRLSITLAGLGIGKVIKDSIQEGMNAVESENLFNVSMGRMANSARAWSEELQNSLGLNAIEIRKNVGVLYNMTTSMGLAQDKAYELSTGLTQLAYDMGSFYNISNEEAFNKVRAGLTGETEPLKALGILVDETTSKQVAYQMGIAKTGEELTQQQKVLARYQAMLMQTGNAQGDLARTLDSPANQLRILQTQLQLTRVYLGQAFMPIVQVVLPILTSFIRGLNTVLQAVAQFMSALFGVESAQSGLGQVSQQLTTNQENVAGSLADTGSAAKKAAKDAKGALASFDEINQLNMNDNQDTSGGSGGAGLGSSGAIPTMDLGLSKEPDISGLSTLAEKVRNFLEPVIIAFENLKKSVQPVLDTIGAALLWFYDNVLVPFAKWTIGNALPAFLNVLSGVMKVLNPLLISFQPLAMFLWSNFLQPIASWTGGVIIDVLNVLAISLSAIGDWMSSNIGVVSTITTTLALFFGVWELTKLMAFIQMSGGVVGAFNAIKTAIELCTIAKVKDFAETVYLTALYAKDFLISIVNGTAALIKQAAQFVANTALKIADTVAQIAMTAATVAWNAVCVVATAVTTAFGVAVAFLTSPIGLVILAITALIGVGVLLYKNWDTVKSVAYSVFSSISTFISGAASNIGNVFKGMINGVISGVNFLIRGLNKLQVPEVYIPLVGTVGGFGFNINEIPYLARGGIIDSPTLAMVGEAGKEAVVPLENTSFTQNLASELGNAVMSALQISGGGSGQPIELTINFGSQTVFKRIIDGINSANAAAGKNLITI